MGHWHAGRVDSGAAAAEALEAIGASALALAAGLLSVAGPGPSFTGLAGADPLRDRVRCRRGGAGGAGWDAVRPCHAAGVQGYRLSTA